MLAGERGPCVGAARATSLVREVMVMCTGDRHVRAGAAGSAVAVNVGAASMFAAACVALDAPGGVGTTGFACWAVTVSTASPLLLPSGDSGLSASARLLALSLGEEE